MAYTTAQLVAAYTNANLGKEPDAATRLTLDAYATQTQPGGSLSDAQALSNTLKLVNPTTAVAVQTYQFFTGAAPSAAGLSYLVNSATNTNDLNDATGVYAKFSQENRFINFAINLATGAGAGAAQFTADYGTGVSYAQVVASAYDKIIGNNAAAAAGVDVSAAVAYLSRQANIDFLTNYVRSNGVTGAANIELAVKAALVGQVLNVSTVSGIGIYANATNALIADLSDGTLSTDTPAGVNIIAAYPGAGVVGTTYTLKAGADTIVGTSSNDVFNALTVDANGADATTFSSFDSIDGGNGVDTLNVYTDTSLTAPAGNPGLPSNVTVKNVEIVNLYNETAGVASLADASKYQGIQELWQIKNEAKVTGLANGVTAGFKDITTVQTLEVETNDTATSAKVALSNVITGSTVVVDGSGSDALAGVTLSGTVAGTAPTNTNLTFVVGEDVTAVTVASSVATTLTIDDTGSTDAVTSVDLSASTGAITFVGDTDVATITGGAGADKLTIDTTTNKASGSTAAISALVNSGAGNDEVTVTTDGNGLTTVNTGAGNDKVTITSRSDTLVVDLGDGSDTFTATVAITAADTIDAGAGIDTLALKLVGSANVGAFKNFDVFDVAGLGADLDLDILSTNNTVTEIVGSAAVGAANVTLSNVGAGVNFRAVGDLGTTNAVTLTQKTAGALTVTLDADETGTADTAIDTAGLKFAATNATTVNAVFDTAYLASITGETAAGDNVSTINLLTGAATSVSVVSGGARANNVLDLDDTSTGTTGKLATVTITGDRVLTLTGYTFAATNNNLGTIDASASTGGLNTSLAFLKNEGTIKLGSGVDTITVTAASTQAGIESVQGFEKAAAVSISAVAADATAKAAAIADADVLAFAAAGSAVADSAGGVFTGGTIANGVLTFTGAGPATLAAALVIANDAAEGTGETVIFQYLNDSYVFQQTGAAADIVVKLTGVTGVTNLVEDSTTNGEFFIV